MKQILQLVVCCALLLACQDPEDDYKAVLEAGEQFAGGEASSDDFSMNAFGHAAPNISGIKQMEFVTGNSFFRRNWVTAPSSTEDLDGLGPLYNARSCSSCHMFDGRGTPPTLVDEEPVDLLFRLSIPSPSAIEWETLPDPNYGDQFNHLANIGIKPEGKVAVSYQEKAANYADGSQYSLRVPSYNFYDLQYGAFPDNMMVSARIAPQLIGLGLLEAISEQQLLAIADPDDADNDGISGRINRVWDVEKGMKVAGRFGWKANEPSVRQQVAGAFRGDMGLTSSIFPEQPCASNQKDCQDAIDGGKPEIREDILDRVTLYSQTLAVPTRRDWQSETVLKGKQLFAKIGCNSCHIPSFTTDKHPTIPEYRNQKIYPYTDLLLHDMGDRLADNRPDGEANGKEWRTPPLWGIGLIETVNNHTFLLHDGRARNVEEAILWHGGEAQQAQKLFIELTKTQRSQLITFVNSL